MKIGIIGLGKLGLPVALAIEAKGHEVMGFDVSPFVLDIIKNKKLPYKEEGAQQLLESTKLAWALPTHIVKECDIIFLAIQTPHDPKYEGATRIPEERVDFNYQYLKEAVQEIAARATEHQKHTTVVIISTVLPGTLEREVYPLLNDFVHLCYNPFFIAMGTVIRDFINPEFVLLGVRDQETADKVKAFYSTIHDKPFAEMPVVDAELTKVAYNTFIGMKIVFVNTLMEICFKKGGNVDNVTNALKMATDRLISPKYLSAGMGDGGGCHPRDNIAMSYIARELRLSHDFFQDLMLAREHQTEWLAVFIMACKEKYNLPVILLGKAFKPETNIQTGSPAILLANILDEKGIAFSHIGEGDMIPFEVSIFFIATKHQEYASAKFPVGSYVIDPFGYMPEQEGVTIIRIGRN